MRLSRASYVIFASVILAMTARSARAQSTAKPSVSKANEKAADVLFREGKALLKEGMTAEACAKFEESERLDPSAGTLLNLGDCYDKAGFLIRAYAAFVESEPMSKAREKTDWAETAHARAEALRQKIPILMVRLKDGESATVDAKPYGREELGAGIMLDPGEHNVLVLFNGQIWSKTFRAELSSKTALNAEFKLLEKPKVILKQEPEDRMKPVQIASIAIMSVGGAAAVTGLVFGVLANGKRSDAEALCPNYANADRPTCISSGARDLNDSAKSSALISTITTTAGLGLGVGGLALFLLTGNSKSAKRSSVTNVEFSAAPGSAQVLFRTAL
jgi:hypothetical protein